MEHRGELLVRVATVHDAQAVSALLGDLHYPTTVASAAARIARLASTDASACLVALRGAIVCGLVTIHRIPLFHRDGELARITSLVVAQGYRRSGVGAALIAACEAHAREHGAERIELTSGDSRLDAHAFYEHQGFAREGLRLTKQVSEVHERR